MFLKAKPIWLAQKSKQMNIQAGFVCSVEKPEREVQLLITGATF